MVIFIDKKEVIDDKTIFLDYVIYTGDCMNCSGFRKTKPYKNVDVKSLYKDGTTDLDDDKIRAFIKSLI